MTLDLNLSTVLSGLILAGILGIFAQLRRLNGRLVKIEEWRGNKEKLDDERHTAQQTENKSIWAAVQWIRERLSG